MEDVEQPPEGSSFRFWIPGEPVPKGRPRVSSRGRNSPIVYTDSRTAEWEKTAAHSMKWQYWANGGREPITGPVEVWASFGMSKPATSGADVDNFAKIALDALQKAGILHNDRTVIKLTAVKYRALPSRIGVTICLIHC